MKRLLLLLAVITINVVANAQADSAKLYKRKYKEASVLVSQGAFKAADKKFKEALKISAFFYGLDHANTINTEVRISNLNVYQGNFRQAIKAHGKVLSKLKNDALFPDKLKLSKARVYNGLGIAYKNVMEYDSSRICYEKSLKIKQKIFNQTHTQIANSYNNLANLYTAQKKYPQSISYHKKALAIIIKNKGQKSFQVARSYNNLARTFTLAARKDSALFYYHKALIANSQSFNSPNVIDVPNKSPYSANKFFNYSIAFETFYRKTELLDIRPGMISHLLFADYLAKGIRENLTYRSEKINFLKRSGNFFETALLKVYQVYLKAPPGGSREEMENLFFYFSERSKANVLLDQIRQKNTTDIPIINLYKAQQSLRTDQALLEFAHSGSSLFVIVADRQKVSIKRLLTISQKQLHELTNEFRFACNSLDVEDFIRDAPKLYNQFIRPVLSLIKNKKRLLIIPSSELVNFPFEALTANQVKYVPKDPLPALKNAHYLLQDYIVSYHVSSTLAFRSHQRRYQKDYTGIGFNKFAHRRFKDLKHSEEEIKLGAASFSKQEVYLGYPAASKKLLSRINTRILHISTHGSFVKDRLIGLLFPKGGGKLDTLGVKDIYQSKAKTELAVLSGCHSGAGKFIQNEGTFGFAHAFLYSGTPSIIYSLWEASDAGSKKIMQMFYSHLKSIGGQDYSKALTLAKRQHLKKYYLPANWGNFVINSK